MALALLFEYKICTRAVVDDMTLPNQGKLHGIEGLSWGDACCSGIDPGGIPRKNIMGQWSANSGIGGWKN